ncbi:MAG: hypothetical protein EOP40_00510 [Rubrivivax sp.]|nr:MAG: hypothetical protein EOP40_00510 [Rubrivivax sp.]
MHYRLDTKDFLDAMRALEHRLARIQARRARSQANAEAEAGRVICRHPDRFTGALDEVPPEHPSPDLPH